MTNDEARERAVVFRAALTLCADSIEHPEMLLVEPKSRINRIVCPGMKQPRAGPSPRQSNSRVCVIQ